MQSTTVPRARDTNTTDEIRDLLYVALGSSGHCRSPERHQVRHAALGCVSGPQSSVGCLRYEAHIDGRSVGDERACTFDMIDQQMRTHSTSLQKTCSRLEQRVDTSRYSIARYVERPADPLEITLPSKLLSLRFDVLILP